MNDSLPPASGSASAVFAAIPIPATPAPGTPALEIRGLRRVHGTGAEAFEAVRGLDLKVARGTVHALLGVNGAGKTSTLEVVEGLAPASAGEVRVLGLDPVKDRAEVRRRTGVLLQHSGFVGDLTVRETLEMWCAGVTGARPVDELVEMLNLSKVVDTRMRGLSGGEHRRVDLACALAGRPELVMLDEPTTGLDPESRRAVWQLVRDLRADGATVLLTTHYLDEAEELADQVSIMRDGLIVREGTVAGVVAEHPSEITFRTTDSTLVPTLIADGVVAEAATTRPVEADGRWTIQADDLQGTLTEILLEARTRGAVLENLDARVATLESVFLSLAADREALRA